jgi:hypothetical protein
MTINVDVNAAPLAGALVAVNRHDTAIAGLVALQVQGEAQDDGYITAALAPSREG